MNVPASPESSQNGIVLQVRSVPPGGFAHTENASSWIVPPMTPVFKNSLEPRSGRKRHRRLTADVLDVHGQYHTGQQYDRDHFVGVSIEGIRDGQAARDFGEAASRFSVVSRGVVTVMASSDDIKNIPLDTPVCVAKSARVFRGFAPGVTFFTIAKCMRGSDKCIGTMMSEYDKRHKTNECKILLL